jgi:hypothetical protein
MKTLSTLFFILVLISCSPVYLPNSRNVPMFSKKGEVQGTFSFGSGYNMQAAVSITNHFGIMANGMYADSKDFNKRINKYTFGEVGLGYYSNSEKYYFDVFGGYGTGKSSSTDSVAFAFHPTTLSGYDINLSSARYNRYFIQPSFGFKKKHFHGAIAYRFSLMDFKTGVYQGKNIDISRSPVVFLEPAIVLKFPFEQFVISIQTGISWPMNKADQYFDYVPMIISTGIGFRIGYKKPEKQL